MKHVSAKSDNIPLIMSSNYLPLCAPASLDLDECAEGVAGCEQQCTDVRSGRYNSYECGCKRGFTLSSDLHNCTGSYVAKCN